MLHWNARMERGMAYVMLGRCENLKDIFIAGDFKKEGIRIDEDALEESKALEKAFLERQVPVPSNLVKVSFLNVRSLRAHFEDVKQESSVVTSEIFGLGETWLYPNETVLFEGFKSCFANVGKGKGLASYSKTNLDTEELSHIAETFSAICVRSEYLDVIFIYLSQGFNKDELFKLLENWIVETKETAILGDVNWNYSEKHDMKDFMAKKNFSQLIKSPTREHGSTIIDHIYINKKLKERGCFEKQEPVHFSDHDLITLFVNKH